nr:MAG TPA: hypothetical protein [Caudoviricetes sp.]
MSGRCYLWSDESTAVLLASIAGSLHLSFYYTFSITPSLNFSFVV